jgi:hypothetical protein
MLLLHLVVSNRCVLSIDGPRFTSGEGRSRRSGRSALKSARKEEVVGLAESEETNHMHDCPVPTIPGTEPRNHWSARRVEESLQGHFGAQSEKSWR